MAEDDLPTFTIRKGTVSWVSVGIVVLTALGIGLAIGFSPGPPAPKEPQIVLGHGHHRTNASLPPVTTTSALPDVESCTDMTGAVEPRPVSIVFGCADRISSVTTITWVVWATSDAVGVGTFNRDTCVPNCATGSDVTYRVDVVLNKPAHDLGSFVFQDATLLPLSGGKAIESAGDPGRGWGTG